MVSVATLAASAGVLQPSRTWAQSGGSGDEEAILSCTITMPAECKITRDELVTAGVLKVKRGRFIDTYTPTGTFNETKLITLATLKGGLVTFEKVNFEKVKYDSKKEKVTPINPEVWSPAKVEEKIPPRLVLPAGTQKITFAKIENK
jgi:hypothetical protein